MSAALYPASANGFALFASSPKDSFHLYSDLRALFSPPKSTSSQNSKSKQSSFTLSKLGMRLSTAPITKADDDDTAARFGVPPPAYTEFGEMAHAPEAVAPSPWSRKADPYTLRRIRTTHA